MPSETDLLNDALGQIGATYITAIDDNSVNARHCKTIYPALRRALLRVHNWNFAEHRIALQQSLPAPTFGYAIAYALPDDFIKLVTYNGAFVWVGVAIDLDTPRISVYKIEGTRLLTNDSPVLIEYVRDITNPNLWDPLFYQTLVLWLASKFANAISKDASKAKELLDQAIGFGLPLAAAVDSQEQSVSAYRADDLIRGR